MRGVAVLTALGALALVPTSASGLVVRETRDKYVDFAGDGCGSTSVATLAAPRHARRVRPLAPRDGEGLRDIATDAIVARITTAVVRVHGHFAVRFTAAGSDDACAQPANYAESGWSDPDEVLAIRYRIRRRVYFKSTIMGTETRPRYRPRRILFGVRTGIFGVRWSRWNGRVARGGGTLLYNNCVPDCATASPQYYRVNIRLSRVRHCGRRWLYTRFFFRFPGAKPSGVPRTHAERYPC